MDSFEQAKQSMRHNDAPFWWLSSGSNKKGQNIEQDEMNASIELLETAVSYLPPGDYKIECTRKVTDRSGSYKFTFNKPKTSGQDSQPQMAGNSSNPHGISDELYKNILEEARFKIKVENMVDDFNDFMKVWPEYKKKIDTLWDEDSDGNGIADVLEGAKKVSDVVQTAKQMKSIFA